jgi:hypothetical protein
VTFETIIDILILVFLGATIIYAARLSIYMKSFQDRRKDMDFLLQDLSAAVGRGENIIREQRAAADQSGMKLQDIINEAKFLSDELRFMTEAGDNLAGRLEKLADRNRELVELLEQAGGVGYPSPVTVPTSVQDDPYHHGATRSGEKSFHERRMSAPTPPPPQKPAPREQGFFIQDRDFDDEDFVEEVAPASSAVQPQRGARPTASHRGPDLKSQAERELYDALRRKPAPRRPDKVQ